MKRAKSLSNWRSVRVWEHGLQRDLRQRHWLWLHGWCIGLVVLLAMWGASHLQMVWASNSLAWRYAVTLGFGYLVYVLVLRLWAAALVRREAWLDLSGDIPVPDIDGSVEVPHVPLPEFSAGGGGDFAGGGASGDFSAVADIGGDVASGALEAVAGADEGAVVVIPVVVVFLIGLAVLFGAGSLLLLYFGAEALLTVAVEIAFGYVSARTAVRVVREGWLSAVVRLTWKPLLGALFCAVALGALVDHFIPQAHSLPQAMRAINASLRR